MFIDPNSRRPYLSPDHGIGGGGGGHSRDNERQLLSLKSKAASVAWSFLNRTFAMSEYPAHINTLDDETIEISPKRQIKKFGRKVAIPEDFITSNVAALNIYFGKKGLGRFSSSHDPESKTYKIKFDANADNRELGAFLSSARDPVRHILADQNLVQVKKLSKQDAFILHQALKLLGGTKQKYILAPTNLQEKGISVIFDSNFHADQFFKYFNELHESADDLVIDLGLSAQRSREDTDFFRIKFAPNWDSEIFLNEGQWYTDANMAAVEAAFNARVEDELA